MYKLIESYPLEDDYKQVIKDVVMELSIEDTWEAFFADDAPYYFDVMIKYLGDEVHEVSKWIDVDDEKYSKAYGYDVEFMRMVKSRLKVEGVPFADHSDTVSHVLLASKTPTQLIFKEINNSKGIPYSETFETHTKWEFRAPFKGSKKVALRHSYQVVWIKKPFLVDGAISKSIKIKTQKVAKGIRAFFKNNAKDFHT